MIPIPVHHLLLFLEKSLSQSLSWPWLKATMSCRQV
jgi:hypothetical protein